MLPQAAVQKRLDQSALENHVEPTEPDEFFDDPKVRQRIGELIARAVAGSGRGC